MVYYIMGGLPEIAGDLQFETECSGKVDVFSYFDFSSHFCSLSINFYYSYSSLNIRATIVFIQIVVYVQLFISCGNS